jgi:hypothetical protein
MCNFCHIDHCECSHWMPEEVDTPLLESEVVYFLHFSADLNSAQSYTFNPPYNSMA